MILVKCVYQPSRNVGTQVWRSSQNSRASNLNRFNKCQSDKKSLPGNGINLQASDIKYKGEERAPSYCGYGRVDGTGGAGGAQCLDID